MSGRYAVAALAAVLLGGCELTEVTLAVPSDVVIAEVVLREGERLQTAYLHRTTTGSNTSVRNAVVVVKDDASGRELVYSMASDSLCLDVATVQSAEQGTCYAVAGGSDMIRAGRRYHLRIELSDRRILTGTTQVPGDFQLVRPAAAACRLAPRTTFDIAWTRSEGAAAYLSAARLPGIYDALRASGTVIEGTGSVELLGLAVTAADTTIGFPAQFGVFDRFDDELHALLLAIRDGLPPNVGAEVMVAAVDNNFVNWIRGSNFNPSGLVRISSIQGDGRGVFGSIVPRDAEIRTTPGPNLPGC